MIPATHSRRAGFSLLELIVVISVIVVVIAMVVPAFNNLARGSHLTTAAASVLDELNLARQTALARNRVVEVRFYALPDEISPTRAYRALWSLVSDEAGEHLSPLGAIKRFPMGLVALDDVNFSTLLSDRTRPRAAAEVENLANAPATPFKAIRFRPTGGAELSPFTSTNDLWFLTIKNEQDPVDAGRPAANFATIQLDPVTGRARQLRP